MPAMVHSTMDIKLRTFFIFFTALFMHTLSYLEVAKV